MVFNRKPWGFSWANIPTLDGKKRNQLRLLGKNDFGTHIIKVEITLKKPTQKPSMDDFLLLFLLFRDAWPSVRHLHLVMFFFTMAIHFKTWHTSQWLDQFLGSEGDFLTYDAPGLMIHRSQAPFCLVAGYPRKQHTCFKTCYQNFPVNEWMEPWDQKQRVWKRIAKPIASMGLVYLRTCTIKIKQCRQIYNRPMDPMVKGRNYQPSLVITSKIGSTYLTPQIMTLK